MAEIAQRDVQTPHFSLPFSFGGLNGGALVNEQDTIDDIYDCVQAIVAFPVGSREDEPTFGRPELVFEQSSPKTMAALYAAVAHWEPRSETIIDETADWNTFTQQFRVAVTTIGEG